MEKFISFIKKFSPEKQLDLMSDPDSSGFVRELTDQELVDAVKTGNRFLKITDKIRIDQYYKWKDDILDLDNPEFSKYDARSMAFILNKLYTMDRYLIERLQEESGMRKEEE